jgi:hypothetical protein
MKKDFESKISILPTKHQIFVKDEFNLILEAN